MPYRYFIELSYKGTQYHGWQIQPNAVSVQEVLNKALSTILRENIDTTGCGRTDTGVHASKFFAHFDTSANISSELKPRFLKSVNALVGYDIAISNIFKMQPDAHARFDAVSRSYIYKAHLKKNPFLKEYSLLLEYEPDVDAMNAAATLLLKHQDFSCFSKSNTQTFTNNCVISYAQWKQSNNVLEFNITADRFLRNMVRAIVGTLLSVGRGELSLKDVQSILDSKNRSKAGESVSAAGLYLSEIIYPKAIFDSSQEYNI